MKKVLAISLSVLFLFSNLYLLIGTHYCGGRAVDTSILIGKTTIGCGMEEEVDEVCERKLPFSEPGVWQKDCCRDHIASLQIEDEFQKRIQQKIIPESISAIISEPITLLAWVEFIPKNINIPDRAPPLVSKDILTLIQVFLI